MIRRRLTILCSIALSCAVLAAQGTGSQTPPPPPQDPQAPTFRLRVDSVSVDVTVTDKQGKPVTDLKQEDFEIKEAGKVQSIESFKLIQSETVETVGAQAPPQILSMSDMARATANPENRVFLIYLDDYHTRAGNALHIRQQLAQFVQGLSSRDLVALLYPLNTIAQATFSRDHDGTAMGLMKFVGRKYNYAPTTPYEQMFAQMPPEQQEQIRNDLSIRTMQSACALLSSLREGRKTMIYVSEGIVANLPAGAYTMGAPPIFQPTPTPTGNASLRQQSAEYFATQNQLMRMRDIFTNCSRGNTSIYAVDPRGLAPSEFGAADNVGQDADRRVMNEALDSLRILADQTDGKAFIGSNNFLPDLKKLVTELSAYYLLGYTSSLAPRDGKFHEIQVRVNRKDIDVHHRKGYWAYSEDEIRRASAPPKPGPPEEVAEALDALASVVEPKGRHTITTWVGATRGESEQAQVTLVWEAMRGASDTAAGSPERVQVSAFAGTKLVFQSAVPRDPNAFRPSGRVTFPAPAGPLRIKLLVENARGQRLDADEANEMIPDFTAVSNTITTPQFFRGRTPVEIKAIKESAAALPSVSRQFSRAERLLMRFEAYGPAGLTPEVSLRMLNRAGEPIENFKFPALAAPAGARFDVDFGVSALPPGDYVIEIRAKAAGEQSIRLVGIRLTG